MISTLFMGSKCSTTFSFLLINLLNSLPFTLLWNGRHSKNVISELLHFQTLCYFHMRSSKLQSTLHPSYITYSSRSQLAAPTQRIRERQPSAQPFKSPPKRQRAAMPPFHLPIPASHTQSGVHSPCSPHQHRPPTPS